MIVDDVCTELDLLANDVSAAEDFGASPLPDKIRMAVEDWLEPRLLQERYQIDQHRTRRVPSALVSYTGGAWVDRAAGELDLRTVLADPAADALYVGLDRPFRGLFLSMTDTVNNIGVAASLTYWNGRWSALGSSLTNGTVVDGAPFGAAGRLAWPTPTDWLLRPVQDSAPLFWIRLQVDSVPAASLLHAVLPITRSRLTQPVALRALSLLYREGIGGSRGDWKEKAESFDGAANMQFELVKGLIRDEFDVDEDGAVEVAEVNSVNPNTHWSWDRG